jgi:hypothetical protein
MNKKCVFPLLKFHPTKHDLKLIGSVQPHGLNFLPQSQGQKQNLKSEKKEQRLIEEKSFESR